MSVVGFTKVNGKYDIKLCTTQPYVCDIQTGYYRVNNATPETQFYPFPSTVDNKNVFIPSRIVEDKDAFKKYVIDYITARGIKCLNMDPCTVYNVGVCCNGKSDTSGSVSNSTDASAQSSNNTNKLSVGWLILMIIVITLLIISINGMLIYFGTRDRHRSYSYY